MKIALSPLEKFRAAGKFLDCTFNKRPLTVSIEVTKRCNARCDFCDYWKITDRDEMTDFTDVVRRFDPLIVVFTGGEPMLRRDLVSIVKSIKDLPGFRYVTLLTHGGFLSETKIKELIAAGVNQINISMNYPDARQDKERGIPGLFDRLQRTIPRMVWHAQPAGGRTDGRDIDLTAGQMDPPDSEVPPITASSTSRWSSSATSSSPNVVIE